MTLYEWTSLAAATGQLALGVLTAWRGGTSPLAIPLALFCFCTFGWNGADLAYTAYGDLRWKLVDHALSPLTAPLALHFVLVFTGRRRRLAAALAAAYVPTVLLGLSAVAGFAWPPARGFQQRDAWSLTHLGLSVPSLVLAVGCLLVHLRETDPEGRRRTRIILLAFAIAVPLAITDLLEVWLPVPELSNVGMLVAAALLAVVALRLRLLGTDLSTSATTAATALSVVVTVSCVVLTQVVAMSTAVVVLGTITAALVVGLLWRMALESHAVRRAREAQLVTLGRFAAQMAHDLKNPLAAIKGAVQFLEEERRRGASLDGSATLLDLLAAQVGRMERSLDEYRRLGNVEPRPAQVDVNDVVHEVLGLLSLAGGRVAVREELDLALPVIQGDRDLIARALENLVRNAVDAMPDGGTVTVTTCRVGRAVAIAVRDTGSGMDPATRERAVDDFFTTKAGGSGLGLPFARRVAVAHGGDLAISSRPGRGTAVEIRLAFH
ncbi:MAG TPA: ATP-binding protein [Haliangiales bacterium]|nr:ATP-binding protein [Haliangiales bacterium]